jgi:hypothetical protein
MELREEIDGLTSFQGGRSGFIFVDTDQQNPDGKG